MMEVEHRHPERNGGNSEANTHRRSGESRFRSQPFQRHGSAFSEKPSKTTRVELFPLICVFDVADHGNSEDLVMDGLIEEEQVVTKHVSRCWLTDV